MIVFKDWIQEAPIGMLPAGQTPVSGAQPTHSSATRDSLSLFFIHILSFSLFHCPSFFYLSLINTWVLSPWCAEPLFLYINVFFFVLSFFHFIHSSLLKLFFHHLMLWGCNIFSYYWLSIAHHLSFSFFHLLFFNSFTFLIYIYIHTHTFLTQNVDWMSCFKIHSWKSITDSSNIMRSTAVFILKLFLSSKSAYQNYFWRNNVNVCCKFSFAIPGIKYILEYMKIGNL